MSSQLNISLDFELLWGLRDHHDKASYGDSVLGARAAIPRILDLFVRYDVAATWATVGMLFCKSRDELRDYSPPEALQPRYAQRLLSNYGYMDDVGRDEAEDPYSFAAGLIEEIATTPRQEIGTHTFSHYYCLEPGATDETFVADLAAALAIARERRIVLKSIVFPRNQYTAQHVMLCRQQGLTVYRGNQRAWPYHPLPGSEQTLSRRGARLLDAHVPVYGDHCQPGGAGSDGNVPASFFLRPRSGRAAAIHGLHRRRIKAAMTRAAKCGQRLHLWWHPHNFGSNTDANLSGLEEILQHYRTLRDTAGMVSRSMAMAVDPPCA
ncbi:MAG: hypothetical protein AAGC57_15310 [Pseudomonadota bacterium]